MPDMLVEESLEFVRSLKTRGMKEKLDISIAGESSLKKDWLREDEDDAWRDLYKDVLRETFPPVPVITSDLDPIVDVESSSFRTLC